MAATPAPLRYPSLHRSGDGNLELPFAASADQPGCARQNQVPIDAQRFGVLHDDSGLLETSSLTSNTASVLKDPPQITPDSFVAFGSRWTDAGSSSGGVTSTLGGSGGVVAWSLAGAGLNDTNASYDFYTGLSVDLGSFLAFDYQAVLRQAFHAWGQAANIEFMQVADGGGNIGAGTNPTIRIVGAYLDGDSNALSQAFYPSAHPYGGDIVFDSSEVGFWTAQSFYLVALHEIGHTLGLQHEAPPPTALMNPVFNSALFGTGPFGTGLQQDDIDGARAVYDAQDFGANAYFMPAGQTNLTLLNDAPLLTINGNASANTITGDGAANTFRGNLGNDIINGGAGIDTAIFSGLHSAYAFTDLPGDSARVTGPDGTDTLTDVEYATFADGTFPLSILLTGVAALGDVLWRHNDGRVTTASHSLPGVSSNSWNTTLAGDFDADGDSDILWRHTQGANVIWEMENGQYATGHALPTVTNSWQAAGTGDFDSDGDSDILWRHFQDANVIWEMENEQYVVHHTLPAVTNSWQVAGTGDFDGDGDGDILWRHFQGADVNWEMENGQYVVHHTLPTVTNSWQVAGTGDFDGDGDADILWRHFQGAGVIWEMENGQYVVHHTLPTVTNSWQVRGVWDFDSDDDSDILLRHDDGSVVYWEIENAAFVVNHNFGVVSNSWQIRATGEFDLA